jgi:hypothetical protein
MAATIVRPEFPSTPVERDARLAELVRDLSGAPAAAVEAAFSAAPPAPAEPLERVAHALVMLRRHGGVRIAGYVPVAAPVRGARPDDLPAAPEMRAGPGWPTSVRAQLMRSRTSSATTASTHPITSANARS